MSEWDIRVGDVVHVQGTVVSVRGGHSVLVHLNGPSSDYTHHVHWREIVKVIPSGDGMPDEPLDGASLLSEDGRRLYRRDDAEGDRDETLDPNDPESGRRFARRWWDYEYQAFVDWPTAYERAGRPPLTDRTLTRPVPYTHSVECGGEFCEDCR